MSKTKQLEEIAKTLFIYHMKSLGDISNKDYVDKSWNDLPHDRDWGCPYTVCKREYFRMARGMHKLMETKKDER